MLEKYYQPSLVEDKIYKTWENDGDFKPLKKSGWSQITINNNLNEYGFLITALHEFAHLLVYEKYKNKVHPQGSEWKKLFKKHFW